MSSSKTEGFYANIFDGTDANDSSEYAASNINMLITDSEDGMIVGLNSWIDCAIRSLKTSRGSHIGNDNNLHKDIVCSQEYLSCALKIAHSLTDQLCDDDQKNKVTMAEGLDRICAARPQQQLRRGYESLAHDVYVRCGTKVALEEKKDDDSRAIASLHDDLEPLPLHFDPSCATENLGNLAQHISSLLEDGSDDIIDYLNIKNANLREDVYREMYINDDAGMAMIQSLGVTFFQLFSGGQKIKEERGTVVDQSSLVVTGTESSNRLDHLSNKTQRMSLSKSRLPHEEILESLGLPTALCDLISNMTDCAQNECISGDESYKSISDVRDDLKMMIDSPDVYLRDLGMAHASTVGLQMESTGSKDDHTFFYGRESDLEMLKESYQRSLSSGSEVAMIYGSSGIGKSMLSRKFIEQVAAGTLDDGSDGVFLCGSFDRLQQSQPLHAISSAFDDYCTWLAGKDETMAEMVSSALKRDLGGDMSSLVTVMPKLRGILGHEFVCGKNDKDGDDAVDAPQRLRYLFCRFIEIILDCQEEPLILFLDDCQWIDPASVALLNQVLLMPKSAVDKQRRLFFFGCCRDDEMNDAHHLPLMLSSLATFGTRTTNIKLTSMGKETVNEMLSTRLSLLPRLTRPLADILYHKTKGSPFFIDQLLIDLRKRRLLYPSLSRRRWVWESDKIRDLDIPDSVAVFIMKSFDCLPPDVLSALCILSCFGSNVNISLIEILEAEIHTTLVAPLDIAVSESIVDKRKGSYCFLHDKLHEAVYDVVNPEQRCLQHVRFGLALGNVAVRERDDMLLITAVSQINHGGPQAVIDREQGVVVASLNLDAGKKAMEMSDFFSAHSFFDHGISYLRKGHWEDNYHLSLELFNLSAKCALMNADHVHLDILIRQIMHYARCFEDKYQAISISITLHLLSGNLPEGVKVILSTLASLGEEISQSPWWLPQLVVDYITPPLIDQHLNQTASKLAEISEETLLRYPAMVEPSKILAMELLSNLCELVSYNGNTGKVKFFFSKMIQITLEHGLSPLSPLAFVQYGNYVAIIKQDFEVGYRYVKLGLALMKQSPSRAHDCQIIFHSTYTKLFVEPKQTAVEFFLEGFKAAMKSGNTRCAMKCAHFYDSGCFWAGKKLNEVVKSMEETMKQMRYHKNLVLLSMMLSMYRRTLRLVDHQAVIPEQIGLTSAFGETVNEEDVAMKIPTGILTRHFNGMYEAFIFREFDKTRDFAEKYNAFHNRTMNSAAHFYNRALYFGLVSFWIGREKNDKKWTARGKEMRVYLEKLAIIASTWNFQNKTYLLQAEEQFCARNFLLAEKLYDDAILSSKKLKFVNEEALANELAGYFYRDTGRKDKSVHYFSQAEEKYREWGAIAKANFCEFMTLDLQQMN